MVGGVYIPPANSRAGRVPYVDMVDAISEAVGKLALAHAVPREHVLLLGDFNAHLA